MAPPTTPQRDRFRPVHGVTVGIVILDTRFERVPGDVGFAGSFPFPVAYAVARGISRGSTVLPGQDGMVDLFVRTAEELVALGVDGISTSCGFLAAFQPYLTRRLPVPVATSSLLQVPLVQRLLPEGRRVGILTANKAALTAEHFVGAGAPPGLPVAGLPPDGAFAASFSRPGRIDRAAHEREVLAMAAQLLAEAPDVGAIVLECTNLSPYAAAIERNFGLPVYDIVTLITWFHSGLRPRRYAEAG